MDPRPPQAPQGTRRAIRRSVAVGCELISTRSDEPLRYRATDLSVGGMWIQTAEPVRAGETVVVCFKPEDGEAAELHVFASVARVMTARDATDDTPGVGMGLELLDLRTEEKSRLERYLAGARQPVPRRRRPVAPSALPEIRVEPAEDASHPAEVPAPKLATCWR